jgi:hypothetical protein
MRCLWLLRNASRQNKSGNNDDCKYSKIRSASTMHVGLLENAERKSFEGNTGGRPEGQ